MSRDWAGPGFSTPYADPDMDPARAQLGRPAAEEKADALAEQAVKAAKAHGAAARQHDLAMDAHAEHAELYGPGPEAEAG